MDLEPMILDLFYEEKIYKKSRRTDESITEFGYQLHDGDAPLRQPDLYGLGSTELSGLKERLRDLSREHNLLIRNRVPKSLAELQVASGTRNESPLVVYRRPLSNEEMRDLASIMLSPDLVGETEVPA